MGFGAAPRKCVYIIIIIFISISIIIGSRRYSCCQSARTVCVCSEGDDLRFDPLGQFDELTVLRDCLSSLSADVIEQVKVSLGPEGLDKLVRQCSVRTLQT